MTGDEGPEAAAFGILGPLEVRGHAGPVTLRGTRQRVALTALLLRANTLVPLDDMIDYIWPERAPATAREQVMTIVHGLRRALGDPQQPPETRLVVTRSPGYLIQIKDDQLDAGRFQRLIREGDRELAAGRPSRAAAALRSALTLWRGPALTDIPALFAAGEAQRLTELCSSAVEKLVDVEFGRGRHRDALPWLVRQVAQHPLRERMRGQLMVALHEAGRTAEALEIYREGRRRMVDELGMEPGGELRRIEQAILTDTGPGQPPPEPSGPHDRAAVTAREPTGSFAAAPDPVFDPGPPAQLPPDVTDFTGRRKEIDDICRHVRAHLGHTPDGDGGALPVVAVSGQPGVGKTALAVRAGHLLLGDFPDGQLHVTLHGTRQHPTDPGEALASMIAALGVPAATIPDDLDERTRLYRTLTADRRTLVVLDDAGSAAQVRPLLPGGHGCAVLVTGRRQLTDLAAAHHLRLGVLPEDDAMALLIATSGNTGKEPIGADRLAARRIAVLCGGLPLALRIAGAQATSHPHWSLGDLAERLADPAHRLDRLHSGDLDLRDVMASIRHALDPALDSAARSLSRLRTPSFTAATARTALNAPPATVTDLIDELVERQLLQYAGRDATGSPCFSFPELLGLYLRRS